MQIELDEIIQSLATHFNFDVADALHFINSGEGYHSVKKKSAEENAAARTEKEKKKAAKLAEKEAKKAAKLAEKEAKKAAKLAEKAAAKAAAKAAKLAEKEAEKEAKKAAKLAEKEAKKTAKLAEKEAKKAVKLAEKKERTDLKAETPLVRRHLGNAAAESIEELIVKISDCNDKEKSSPRLRTELEKQIAVLDIDDSSSVSSIGSLLSDD